MDRSSQPVPLRLDYPSFLRGLMGVAALLCLAAGCKESSSRSASVEVNSATTVTPVGVTNLILQHDGEAAWGWSSDFDGIRVFNADGSPKPLPASLPQTQFMIFHVEDHFLWAVARPANTASRTATLLLIDRDNRTTPIAEVWAPDNLGEFRGRIHVFRDSHRALFNPERPSPEGNEFELILIDRSRTPLEVKKIRAPAMGFIISDLGPYETEDGDYFVFGGRNHAYRVDRAGVIEVIEAPLASDTEAEAEEDQPDPDGDDEVDLDLLDPAALAEDESLSPRERYPTSLIALSANGRDLWVRRDRKVFVGDASAASVVWSEHPAKISSFKKPVPLRDALALSETQALDVFTRESRTRIRMPRDEPSALTGETYVLHEDGIVVSEARVYASGQQDQTKYFIFDVRDLSAVPPPSSTPWFVSFSGDRRRWWVQLPGQMLALQTAGSASNAIVTTPTGIAATGIVAASKDESKWWIGPPDRKGCQLLHLTSDGFSAGPLLLPERIVDFVIPETGESEHPRTWAYAQGSAGLWFLDSTPAATIPHAVFPNDVIQHVALTNRTGRAWVQLGPGRNPHAWHVVDLHSPVPPPQLSIGSSAVGPGSSGQPVPIAVGDALVVRASWLKTWRLSAGTPRALLSFIPAQPGSSEPQATVVELHQDSDQVEIPLPRRWKPDGVYRLRLQFVHQDGTNLEYVWPPLAFAPREPLFTRPAMVAVYLWAALLLTVVLTRGARQRAVTAARVAPVSGGLVAGVAASISAVPADPVVFAALVGGTLCAGLGVGWLHPETFRDVARLTPFDQLLPHLLRFFPGLRRRLFASYVAQVHDYIRVEKLSVLAGENVARGDEAISERYVSLPASLAQLGNPETIEAAPARRLCALLLAGESASVFIHAGGGRGKSALLRELVTLLLANFEREGHGPLPVIVDTAGDLESLIQQRLGEHLIWTERLEGDLADGDYVLVLDGLSEKQFDPAAVARFRSKIGGRFSLLIATRSDGDTLRALSPRRHDVLVTPLRLDDRTLPLLEAAYMKPGQSLGAMARAACRSPDGTYLPILVRLAALEPELASSSIADIYEAAFAKLAGPHHAELRKTAPALCLATYWETGYRQFHDDVPERASTIAQLRQSGLILPAGTRLSGVDGAAHTYRFFHDTMQTFLTAKALNGLHDSERWPALLEAAANPRFLHQRSEFMGELGSELFQMCIQVFRPEEELRRHMELQLRSWAHECRADITSGEVVGALPLPFAECLDLSHAGGAVLLEAVDLAIRHPDSARLLGALYFQIAQHAYARRPSGGISTLSSSATAVGPNS